MEKWCKVSGQIFAISKGVRGLRRVNKKRLYWKEKRRWMTEREKEKGEYRGEARRERIVKKNYKNWIEKEKRRERFKEKQNKELKEWNFH